MTEGMTSKGTDRLTPGMLRDLAAIFLYREQQPHKPYLHAVFDREAARREAEGKPDPLACPFCGGSGHKDDIRISGSVMREGPGSADAPKLVPNPPYIGPKPAPAADDLVRRLRAVEPDYHYRPRYRHDEDEETVKQAADRIEATFALFTSLWQPWEGPEQPPSGERGR